MTVEMGKPITEAEHEIGKCLLGLDYFLSQAPRILEPAEFQTAARKSYVRYDPLGVIFGIMPWNFPFWQVLRFAIPALLAGNTILLKHAPNVPQSALKLESLFHEAGCGDVFQNLFVDNETAARWIASDSIAGVSLTGSSRAGSAVAETAGTAPSPAPVPETGESAAQTGGSDEKGDESEDSDEDEEDEDSDEDEESEDGEEDEDSDEDEEDEDEEDEDGDEDEEDEE
jgi:acyl-CoA reductase-like NAD-dependent aldehyde dehydrogenase